MAHSARSNRKKGLRTVRRAKVDGAWMAAADAKRQAALDVCAAAAPLVVLDRALDLEKAAAAERVGRVGLITGGAAPMAIEAPKKQAKSAKNLRHNGAVTKKRQGSKASQKVSMAWSKANEKKTRKKR